MFMQLFHFFELWLYVVSVEWRQGDMWFLGHISPCVLRAWLQLVSDTTGFVC